MKALILRQDPDAAHATSRALMDKGFQILCIETQCVAHALIRVDTVDLLVMDERIEGQLTHAIALSGERRNPYLSTILLTDRIGEDTDDLYELIPCLYALAGMNIDPKVIGQLALSSVSNVQETQARVARRQAEVKAEADAEARENIFTESLPSLDQTEDDVAHHDDAPDDADLVFAEPSVAKITAQTFPTPLERIDQVIMAQVAAVFRNHEHKYPQADMPTLPHADAALAPAHP